MTFDVRYGNTGSEWFDTYGEAHEALVSGITEYVLDFWREHPEIAPFTRSDDVPESIVNEWYERCSEIDDFYFTDDYDRYTLSYIEEIWCGRFYDWGDWCAHPEIVEYLKAKI